MTAYFSAVLGFILLFVPFAFAVPDAPAYVWFESNESVHYDTGTFSINWTAVTNEPVSNYTVYILDVPDGNISNAIVRFVFHILNPGDTSLLFSGTHGTNYSFMVSATSTGGVEGPNATSDWIFVDSVKPNLALILPTPVNNTYLPNNTLTIRFSSNEILSSLLLNWEGTNELANITSIGEGGGYHYYTISKILPAEGRYFYSVSAEDGATNHASTEVRAVIYDVTSPVIMLAAPKNITYRTTRVPLNYSTYDISPVSCKYTYNSADTQIPGCVNTTFVAIDNATTTVTLWVTDSAGNTNFTSADFSVNTTPLVLPPPVILSVYPANNTLLEPPSIIGNTTPVNITTSNISECRYSMLPGTDYENMTSRFNNTNSTVHNLTLALAHDVRYNYYIRCRVPGGDPNREDYQLTFTTSPFINPIQLDPSGAILKSGIVMLELIIGRTSSFNMSIANLARYPLARPGAYVTGTAFPYLNITLPSSIPANSTSSFTVSANAASSGNYNSSITISSGNYSSGFSINMAVFDDFIYQLNDLKTMRQDYSTRLYTLQMNGADVAVPVAEAERLQTEVNDAISLYNSGQYSEAQQKYAELNSSIAALGDSVKSAEAAQFLKNNANNASVPASPNYTAANPPVSTGTGSSSNVVLYVIIGIVLVIIAVVLATSIVPDDEEESPGDVNQKWWSKNRGE